MDAPKMFELVRTNLAGNISNYLSDLAAIPDDKLGESVGGQSRTPYDLTYEVAQVNDMLTSRMRGEPVQPFEFKGWVKAPDEFCTRDRITAEFTRSSEDLLAAFDSLGAGALYKEFETPYGPRTPYQWATFASMHIMYHDAQLNLMQAIYGDEEVHWNR